MEPAIRGGTSNWRCHLQLEVGPPIGGGLCMLGHTGAPMLHVGISYSFEKKKRLFIVDYIKPSPVYQVKCKLVSAFGCCGQKFTDTSRFVMEYLWPFISFHPVWCCPTVSLPELMQPFLVGTNPSVLLG